MNRYTCIAILISAVALMARAEDSVESTDASKLNAEVNKATLQCNVKSLYVSYSFEKAKTVPNREADINFYFDDDDCEKGAIFGHDDRKGFIFPVGEKSWKELSLRDLPGEDTESVIGFLPITKDKEGLAFWLKTKGGKYVLVRIKSVQPAAYPELKSGKSAKVDLEWAWGLPREE